MDKKEIIRQIDLYTTIGNNWDGYGGMQLSERVADKAKEMIPYLMYLDKVTDCYPNPHGTVCLDFEAGSKELSLEIGNSAIGYFSEISNSVVTIIDSLPIGLQQDLLTTVCTLNNDLKFLFSGQ